MTTVLHAEENLLLDTIAELKTSQEQKLTASDAELLGRQFPNLKAPRERKIAALTLGRYYLEEKNFMMAKTYFVIAKEHAENDEMLKPIIQFHLAELEFAQGNHRDVNRILLQEVRNFSRNKKYTWQKPIAELLIANLTTQKNHVAIRNLYPRFKKLGLIKLFSKEILTSVAQSLAETKNFKEETRILEHLAKDYPLTAASGNALNLLKHYNQTLRPNGMPKYIFSERLLKAISANHPVSESVVPFVEGELKDYLVDYRDRVVKLDPIKRFDFLLKFNLLDLAKKHLPAANAYYNQNTERHKKDWLLVMGRYHSTLNEPALASAYFAQHLEFDKSMSNRDADRVWEQTAYEHQRMGDFAKAATIFKGLAQRRRSANYEWDYFWNTYLSGDYKAALLQLENKTQKAFVKDKFEPLAATYWRAKIHRKLGREDIAQRFEDEILQKDRGSYYGQLILAGRPSFEGALLPRTEMKNGDIATATYDYRLAAKALPASLHSKEFQTIEDLMMAGWKKEAEMNFYDLLRKSVFNQIPPAAADQLRLLELPIAYQHLVRRASKTFDLNEYLILSIMRAESGFRQDAESLVGARGLMQIMPRTAFRIAKLNSHDDFDVKELTDPAVNITYSSFYLNKLLHFYKKNLLLTVAAYNAGPKATNSWRKRFAHCEADELVESIPFAETRQYVKKVVRYFGQYLSIYENKQPPMDIIDTQEGDLPTDTDIF